MSADTFKLKPFHSSKTSKKTPLRRFRRRSGRVLLSKAAKVGKLKKLEMEMKNWKLYMENKSIIEENQRLQHKAFLLHQENKALLSQLQKCFSSC
nr:protein LITTLE ZIPPER 1-like [Ipomoea batatas]GMD62045.1 protein LITTLE ZIPPER 1-like [Ipomoea batatas]